MRPRTLLLVRLVTGLMAGAIALPTGALAQESPAPVASPGPLSSAGAATPEDAVAAYLTAVAAGDVDAILAASAVDEMAAGFDFVASAERLRALNLNFSLAPSEYPMYAAMNGYQQAAQILAQVRNLAYGLLSDETIDGSIIAPVDEAQAAAFAASVDPSRLADLALVEVRAPEPEVTSSERYLDTVAQIAATYAADEMVERLALIELDGETFGLGLSLLRYGDEWSVSTQSSPVGGTSALGTAEPMTRQEFDARTGG